MGDDIVKRLRAPAWPCICVDAVLINCIPCNVRLDAADEIERLRDLCYEAQAFIEHNKNCAALMGWAKDCSCGYDEMWRKLNV